jgi:hypothetical protein
VSPKRAAKKAAPKKRTSSKAAPTKKRAAPTKPASDDSAMLAELLNREPETAFTADQIAGKAFFRWERDQLVPAAVLFEAAARRATAEATAKADETMTYRARAAVCLAEAGEIERAWPLLEESIAHDWGVCSESHFCERAFVEMLAVHAARSDRKAFVALFARAVARGDEHDEPFPYKYTPQERTLDFCEALRLTAEARIVAERIRERTKLPRKLAARIARYSA